MEPVGISQEILYMSRKNNEFVLTEVIRKGLPSVYCCSPDCHPRFGEGADSSLRFPFPFTPSPLQSVEH